MKCYLCLNFGISRDKLGIVYMILKPHNVNCFIVQGVNNKSGKSLSSKFGRKQMIPQTKALIFRRAQCPLAVEKTSFCSTPSYAFRSRRLFERYNHFQGFILKLNIRAFFWGIVYFSKRIGSFQSLNSNIFRICLLHPVYTVFLGMIYSSEIRKNYSANRDGQ